MRNPVTILCDFVLEQLQETPVLRRIQLMRALAEVTADRKQRQALTHMADELEAIQQRHEQLLLNLKQGGRRA